MDKSLIIKELQESRIAFVSNETDLDLTTCDEEALAYFSRPDSEKYMSLEGWKALYNARLKDDYYDRQEAKEEAIANHPLMKAVPPFQLDLYMKVYESLSASYPWPE